MRQYWETENYRFPAWKSHQEGLVFTCEILRNSESGSMTSIIRIENVGNYEEILKERPLMYKNDKIINIRNEKGEIVWEFKSDKSRIKTSSSVDKTWLVRFIKNDQIVDYKITAKDKITALTLAKSMIETDYDDLIDLTLEGGKVASWSNRILKSKFKQKLKDYEDAKKGVLKNKAELEQYIIQTLPKNKKN